MSDPLLDLTAQEADRRAVKIDDGDPVLMASPDALSPRDFARIAAMEKLQVEADDFDEAIADELELRMTEAACVLLPDVERDRVAAMPFLRRARLIQAFTTGHGVPPSTPVPDEPTTDRSTSGG